MTAFQIMQRVFRFLTQFCGTFMVIMVDFLLKTVADLGVKGEQEKIRTKLREANPESLLGQDSLGNTWLHNAIMRSAKDKTDDPGKEARMVMDTVAEKVGAKGFNCTNNAGETPLHVAARCGTLDVLDRIVRHHKGQSNVEQRTKVNLDTALMYAAAEARPEAARCLIIQGNADVLARNAIGQTVLHRAAESCHDNERIAECINVLMVNGSNVNAKDVDGNTPLHAAARSGNSCAVGALLEVKGIKVNNTNHQGYTALDVAVKMQQSQPQNKATHVCVGMLTNQGGKSSRITKQEKPEEKSSASEDILGTTYVDQYKMLKDNMATFTEKLNSDRLVPRMQEVRLMNGADCNDYWEICRRQNPPGRLCAHWLINQIVLRKGKQGIVLFYRALKLGQEDALVEILKPAIPAEDQ